MSTTIANLTIYNGLNESVKLRPDGNKFFYGTEGTDYKITDDKGFDRDKGTLDQKESLKVAIYGPAFKNLLVGFSALIRRPELERRQGGSPAFRHLQR